VTIESDERQHLARKVLAAAPVRIGSLALMRLITVVRVMVFARLFMPAEIGTAALALICGGALAVFADCGIFQSVIRKRDAPREFENTAFTLSLIFSVVVFGIALAGAPLLSRVLSADIDGYIRFAALVVFAIPLRFPRVFWEKEIDFVHPSISLLVPELTALVVAVGAEVAFQLGVWSLLAGHVCGIAFSGVYVWVLARRWPRIQIQSEDAREILGFGSPLLVQRANGWVMSQGDNALVGTFAGTTQLAFYNFSWQLPMMISTLVMTVDSTLLPVFARLNHSNDSVRRLFNLASKMWSIAGAFFGFAMIIFADAIVHILYGPNWVEAVPLLRLMAVSFVIRFCSGYAYDNLVLVRGRTKYMMKWGFVNTALICTLGLYMIRELGAIGGAWFWIFQAVVFTPMLRLPLIQQELRTLEFVKHVWQPVLAGAVAALCAHELRATMPPLEPWALLASAVVYLAAFSGSLLLLDRELVGSARKLVALAR
jgi:PST family polysaccharide transporter